jgi:hypothetical protein
MIKGEIIQSFNSKIKVRENAKELFKNRFQKSLAR